MARENPTAPRTQMRSVQQAGAQDVPRNRAHLNESLVRIDDTLKGNMQRSTF